MHSWPDQSTAYTQPNSVNTRNRCELPLQNLLHASIFKDITVAWPFSRFTSLSAYRRDPGAVHISVTQHTDVATNNQTSRPLLLQWNLLWNLKTDDWLVNGCLQHITSQGRFYMGRVGLVKWEIKQCVLSSNTWECLWQAFQEEDQYISYHVSHIDHWFSIVIRVPNGKPVLLILERQKERDTELFQSQWMK